MTPTMRAVGILAAISVSAVLLPLAVVGLLAIALIVAVIVDMVMLRGPVAITREVPAMLSRGVKAPLRLGVATAPAGVAQLRQARPPDLDIVPSSGRSTLEAQIVGLRRGAHQLPPAALRLIGPLGLAFRSHCMQATEYVRVYPDLPTAFHIVQLVRTGRFSDAGHAPRGPLGLGTEFERVRDYVPDDDVRQINWRATARVGRPMSNQYRLEQDRDVILLVDAGRLMGAPLDRATRLDLAIDVAVAVAAVADELGDHCGAVVFDSAVQRVVRPHRRARNEIIEALFDVEPTGVDSDYLAASRQVGDAKRAMVMILTDLIDLITAEPLISAVRVLAKRHTVAVVCAVDTMLGEHVRAQPSDVRDVYEAAVAHGAIAERRHVVGALTGAGAQVIEAHPTRMAYAGVAAYLRAKRRGRL